MKSSPAALAFPFFVIAMIPYRMSLRFLFSPMELEAVSSICSTHGREWAPLGHHITCLIIQPQLDGPNAGQVLHDDEPNGHVAGNM